MVEKEVKFKITVDDEATSKLQEIKSQMDALNNASYQITAKFASQPTPSIKPVPAPSPPTIKPEMEMPTVPAVSIPSAVEEAEVPEITPPKMEMGKIAAPEIAPIIPPSIPAPEFPSVKTPSLDIPTPKIPEIAFPEIASPKAPSPIIPEVKAVEIPAVVSTPKIPPVTPKAISHPVQKSLPPAEEIEYPKYMTGRDIEARETLKSTRAETPVAREPASEPEKKKPSAKKTGKPEVAKENMMIPKEYATPLRAIGAYRSAWFAGQDTSKGPMKAAAGLFILQAVADGIQKIIQILSQASPLLRAEIKILRIATEQMLRPIGDLLGAVLRPMSRAMLKANAAARSSMAEEGIDQTDLSQYYARFTAAMAAQISGEEVLGENAVDLSDTVTALDALFKFLGTATLPGLVIAFTDVMTWVDENKDMFPMFLAGVSGIVTDVVAVQTPLRQLTDTVIDLNNAVQGLCGAMETITDVSSGAAGVLGGIGDLGDIGKTVENTFSKAMGYFG